nr:hypothetical protein [Tanacetum cinerariifolium]
TAAVSPTADSPGYITAFDHEEDPKEEDDKDPEEDPTDYHTDRDDDEEEDYHKRVSIYSPNPFLEKSCRNDLDPSFELLILILATCQLKMLPLCFLNTRIRLNSSFLCVSWLSVCILDRPIGKEGCASWDGGKGTWGGQARVFGTVPPLPAAASPTTDSPGYIPESDPDKDPEDDDDEDPEEDPADYPTDHDDDDDEEEEEPSRDDADEEDEEQDEDDDDEEEEHSASADSIPLSPALRVTARISFRPQPPTLSFTKEDAERFLAMPIPPPSPLTPLSSPIPTPIPT